MKRPDLGGVGAGAGGAADSVPRPHVPFAPLYRLALLDLERGHNVDAALNVLTALENLGVEGLKA